MKKNSTFLSFLLLLLGFFLHQSLRINIGNTSGADLILIFLLIYVFLNKDIKFKKKYITILVFFMIHLILISVFFAPALFNITVSNSRLIIEITKLIVLFLFFYIGKELAKRQELKHLLKIYSNTALFIGMLVLLFSFLDIPAINEIMFVFYPRANGFMNDPNYFAILQISALPFFMKNTEMNKKYRFYGITILILSVILSGSKTGFMTLFLYLLLNQIETVFLSMRKKTLRQRVNSYIVFLLIAFSLIIILSNFTIIVDTINDSFPASIRVTRLFTDFGSSISSDGSGRGGAWSIGIENIKKSPIFGVGLGNYGTIGEKLYGTEVIPHNTYIQLAAEWGLPLALIFFLTIFSRIIKVTFKYNQPEFYNLSVQKDILIIFLIGSVGISLNNARFFWLVLGSFMYMVSSIDKKKDLNYKSTV